MRGWRISHHGGPEALEWCELPAPRIRPDEVLVAVRACALNRLDLWLRDGVPGHRFPLPLVPGSEVTGEVVEVGEVVGGVAPGDAVLIAPGLSCGRCPQCLGGDEPLCAHYGILGETRDGGYAELIAVPGRNVLPLPPTLSFVEAAAVPLVFLTAWHMLVARVGLRPHEDVLIHAAGSGVSSAAIQIARLHHARRIIATAGSEQKLQAALALGATHAVNYRDDDFVARCREITGRRGVDVVVDHVGGEVFERSLKLLAPGGRVVLCGATAGGEATINLRATFFKNLSILGSTMGSLVELLTFLPFFASGRLRPVVDRTFPLDEARAAQEVLARRENFGKVVLTVGDAALAHRRPGNPPTIAQTSAEEN